MIYATYRRIAGAREAVGQLRQFLTEQEQDGPIGYHIAEAWQRLAQAMAHAARQNPAILAELDRQLSELNEKHKRAQERAQEQERRWTR